MTKRETYESRTEQLLQPMMEEHQFELVDVEYVKEGGTWYLRAYIDKPDGITINDCEVISRALSDALDEEDFIEDSYVLEVSSPGLGRPLKKDKDFQRSIGEAVELKLYKPVDGSKDYTGILLSFDKDTVTIEKEDGNSAVFQRDALALIRLAFDF
ncbi:MAG TPA: ribosome maturation factor RimP [Lachnospiraceae bacterium]|nr:ribosome maturation factor RimP [Lachnospiraceae bacterium]